MSEVLPQFVRTRVPTQSLFDVYSCLGKGVTFFLAVMFSVNDDRFTLEIGWSRKGRFPLGCPYLEPRDDPLHKIKKQEPVDGEFYCRIGRLLSVPRDKWWWLTPQLTLTERIDRLDQLARGLAGEFPLEEALANIPAAVGDAIKDVCEVAVPYFDEIAATLTLGSARK